MKPFYSSTIFVFFFVVNAFFGFTQPANDACASAISLPCGTTNLAGTTVGAVSETSPGTCVGSYGVWYTFVGNGSSTTISVTSPMDIGVSFKYGSCGSLNNVTCVDIPPAGGTETYTFTPTNGITYFIYIAYWSSGSTTGTFTVTRTCVTPPSNDLCSNATSLPCGTTNLAGTTVNTVSETPGVGCTMSGYGVWYSFVGDGQTTTISSTSTSASFDHEMAIVSGSCGSFSNITCEDIPAALGTETYTFTTTNGVTYYVYIADWENVNNTGTFTISRSCVAAPTPPVNDACASATALPCGTSNLAGSTVNSVSETPGVGCTMSGYGVWYSFVGDGQTTTISSTSTSGTFDHEMAIVSGSCGSFSNITCEDIPAALGTETYTFTTTNGVTYYVYIADWENVNNTGTFTISRSCVAAPTPPVNDACASAIALPCETVALAGTTANAAVEAVPSTCGMSAYGVWYSFTGDGGTASLTLQGTGGFDTGIGVYSGACGTLTNIDCEDAFNFDDAENVTFTTTNGTNYFVYVAYFESGSTTGTFEISRTCPLPTSQDCIGAIQICDDQALSGNSSGFGVQELNSSNFGCFAGGISEDEDQSSWYFFQATTTGTLEFILTSQPSVDYDFIIWGPNKSCSSLGSPIRCDASAVYEETGMVTLNPDNGSVVTNTSSNPGATSTWIQSLNVTMGQTYIMMINNFTANATPFALDWTFSVPGLLNCTPISLPIEFGDFYGFNKFNENQLYWKSLTEHNNDYYTLERSRDGHFWETIHILKGAINSTSPLNYSFNDYEFTKGLTNYYRLSQTDLDGLKRELKIISIDNRSEGKAILRRINLLGQIVDESYRGLVIIEFEDGSTQKIVQ